jgi:hypothetical protein
MKFWFLSVLCVVVSIFPAMAQSTSNSGGFFSFFSKKPPAYVSEATLPEGWPQPGPFDQVVKKNYPAYRAAFTPSQRPNSGFWTLFKHIKSQAIPMSAPVEMTMAAEGQGPMEMAEMGFIYPSRMVGHSGAGGKDVVVRDVPACLAYSYTWQGPRNEAAITKALAALDKALVADHVTAKRYRILSYNSPFISRSKQTHELQAILK